MRRADNSKIIEYLLPFKQTFTQYNLFLCLICASLNSWLIDLGYRPTCATDDRTILMTCYLKTPSFFSTRRSIFS